jgi:cytochrome c biogenesis protein CcmG, thiol:disulfide interchange protein DsbE
MSRWLTVIPLVVLAGLAVLFIGWSLQRDPEYRPDAIVGQTVPETVLPILQGDMAGPQNVDLKTAGVGRPMLVNLFASWCAPCRIEHPQLMGLKARGVAVVGVAYKDDPIATRAFLDELGDPFTMVLVDREGRAGLDLGVSGVPETFAVDAMGRIVAKASGPLLTEADVDRRWTPRHAPCPQRARPRNSRSREKGRRVNPFSTRFVNLVGMSAIRPDLPVVQPAPTGPSAQMRAAQAAFFRAALAEVAPVAAPATATSSAQAMTAEEAPRLPRPGALLDIRV